MKRSKRSKRSKRLTALALTAFAVALSACSPETAATAWHWDRFVGHPDAKAFDDLYPDVKACVSQTCSQREWIDDKAVESLAARVRDRNILAARVAMSAGFITQNHGYATRHLSGSFGPLIRTRPEAFLEAARTENCRSAGLVTGLPGDLAEDYNKQYDELAARRQALARVSAPDLIPVRDFYVAALDKQIVLADASRFHMPNMAHGDPVPPPVIMPR